jgi:hypothetical protein
MTLKVTRQGEIRGPTKRVKPEMCHEPIRYPVGVYLPRRASEIVLSLSKKARKFMRKRNCGHVMSPWQSAPI